ncbi:FAD binding domain-containing protein [Ralstonia pseudosolanacearum]|uniref:FAD binding domain-containing protein n=1 Tax=Ralstonia pseudosolanacearum TaxID=1310165 RepID=UPI0026750BAE|nr:FAD binding domain-containing protein [Ralstonia pseudosolanacearum]MDO3521461.1 FAD binding domain-containing protein [Ralstonia pseudosolanacearum]MDO3545380.1 FAD binding domain-containing protein [Ralstonia pseudosolanacearum]MDO3550815.1 FAD binding domain-containing protein [Ralstonia pseudosolanacearum]MDO3565507.1 FAD binding domain-containing protein [Ralstonia pseudosolanacearum]MDO3580663.1 FAD binding domain-containing protein [Ralstonia pseudosolanacearum]
MCTQLATHPHPVNPAPRALVIGGSLGGLFAGNLLRRIGWHVDLYERSAHDLDSRGGGIVLQPDVVEVFRRTGVDLGAMDLGVGSVHRTVLRPDGSIRSRHFAPQTQTSWSLIYTTLRAAFGDAHYHQAKTLARIEQNPPAGTVTAHFTDGSSETADLLIGADGGNSAVRRQLWPDKVPTYAGYLAWRGLVPEEAMPPPAREMLHGDFGFANNRGSHILGYLVPGEHNDVRPGHRLYNWVWYRVADTRLLGEIMTDREGRPRGHSIPEGMLDARWVAHLRDDARALLPPAFREIVEATAQPFAQAIRDLASDHMVSGRVVILGDAASIPRPHTAASTSKAAANALALADALQALPDDVPAALSRWEPEQIALGKALRRQGMEAGNYLLFQRPPEGQVA